MTSTRPFHMNDLFQFNNVNLDTLTETFNMSFYLTYMSRWPELFTVAESPHSNNHHHHHHNAANNNVVTNPNCSTTTTTTGGGSIMGYMIGKCEGHGRLWHGHVSAVTVAPLYRRLGLAKLLMDDLECTSNVVYNAYFVDLFVRASNT
jgi:N-terminal acetyltransferase B complex catalytic subunit